MTSLNSANAAYMTSKRPTRDQWALGICYMVAIRAECTRRMVGAIVLNKHGRIVAAGYNGAPKGKPSCLDGACPRGRANSVEPGSSYDTGDGSCIAIHAEANALLDGNRADLEGGTLYCTDEPCGGCARLIAGSGVVRVVWPQGETLYS